MPLTRLSTLIAVARISGSGRPMMASQEKVRLLTAIRNTDGASRRAAPRRNTSAPPSRAPRIDMTKP